MPDEIIPDPESTPTDPQQPEAQPDPEDGLPDAVRAVLKKERAAAKAAERRAQLAEASVKAFEERDKTDAEKQIDRIKELEKQNSDLALENLRRDVAAEKGLTPAQAKRLSGSTRDELEADADDLLETFGNAKDPQQTKPFGDVGQGHRGTPPNQDEGQVFARFLRGQRGS